MLEFKQYKGTPVVVSENGQIKHLNPSDLLKSLDKKSSNHKQDSNFISIDHFANLAPRKMRFGLSESMILSSENKDGLFLMPADDGATAGRVVKF